MTTWKKLSEEMPPLNEKVLICISSDILLVSKLVDENKFCSETYYEYIAIEDVIVWAPIDLPEYDQ